MTRHKTKKEMEAIGYMIQQRLKARALVESPAIPFDTHLDEDTICAFVEGRLGQAESSPIVSHLIACGFCRRATAQLLHLESQTTEEPDSATLDNSPSRLHSFFESPASCIIPSSEEDVVFAYQSPVDVADREIEGASESTPVGTARTEIGAEAETPAENQEIDQ